MKDAIKLIIFKGEIFKEGDKIKFLKDVTNKDGKKEIDKGYECIVTRNELEKEIKIHALAQGMKVDAYDEKGNIFWSNYQEIEPQNKFEELKAEYESLSGQKARGTWGEKKLTEEIEKLK